MPQEFTPELNSDYLQSLLRPIGEQQAQDRGRARSEALARGLEGDVMEGSMVSAADRTADEARTNTISDFNYKIAGLNREERLMNLQEQWHKDDQSWQSSENAQDRQQQFKMAMMGDANAANLMRQSAIYGQQGAAFGALSGFGSSLLGYGMAKNLF